MTFGRGKSNYLPFSSNTNSFCLCPLLSTVHEGRGGVETIPWAVAGECSPFLAAVREEAKSPLTEVSLNTLFGGKSKIIFLVC